MNSSSDRPHRYSYSMAFAILVGASIPALAFGRTVFAVLIGLALVSLMASPLRKITWLTLIEDMRSSLGILVFIVIFSWSLSALGSDFPLRSLEASIRTGLFIALALIIYSALSQDAQLSIICLKTLTLMVLGSSGFALLASLFLPEIYWLLRFKGWDSTPLESAFKGYSALIVLVSPVLIIGVLRLRLLWKFAALAGFIMLLSIMLLSVNRSAIAGLLFMAMTFSFTQFFRPQYLRKAFVIGAGFVTLFISAMFWLRHSRLYVHQITNIFPDQNWFLPIWLVDFQRQTIWNFTVQIWKNAPWFGIGPNTINFQPGAHSPLPGDDTLHLIPAHPHNWVVEVLAETGALGLFLLLLALGAFGVHWIRRYADKGELTILSLLLISGGYWGAGLFNFSYWSAWWQFSFFITLAITAALAQDKKL